MNPIVIQSAVKSDLVKKIVIILLAILLFIIIIYQIRRLIKKNYNRDLVRDSKKQIDKNNLTWNEADYSNMASTIESAMTGLDVFGQAFPIVFSTIKQLKNKDDWYALVTAFGIRKDESLSSWMQNDFKDVPFQFMTIKNYVESLGATL